jgi:hypothetical protein
VWWRVQVRLTTWECGSRASTAQAAANQQPGLQSSVSPRLGLCGGWEGLYSMVLWDPRVVHLGPGCWEVVGPLAIWFCFSWFAHMLAIVAAAAAVAAGSGYTSCTPTLC